MQTQDDASWQAAVMATNAQIIPPTKPTPAERIEALKHDLPERFEPFSDKYFLRTHQILKAEGINPFVRAQVFIRKGPGEVAGVEEALAMLEKFTNLKELGGRVLQAAGVHKEYVGRLHKTQL